ncbi:acyltransferase family protein [Aestuariivivens sediminis]|uniref:acyltransferase family protein n=1 Tax=Aestuariivivens sediminis TaxID=2913557 RepID=UPI001F56BF03|nr:acyltransferase [Aestuariivivens sediminis]
MNLKTGSSRIYGLDVYRAMAIGMVVISHANYIFQGYDFEGFQILGVQGVELFFVLSGFLIGGLLLRLLNTTTLHWRDVLYFWIRRWFRTLPLYYAMLLVNIIIALIVGYGLPENLWKYLFFLQNFWDYHTPFFPESWSLSVEEYAYVLAPLCLYIGHKVFKKVQNKETLFLAVSIFLVLLFFVTKWYYYSAVMESVPSLNIWNARLKSIVIYRLDAIFYGFILVYYFNKYKTQIERAKYIFFFLGLVLCVAVLIIMPLMGVTIEQFPFYWNVLYLPLNSIGLCLIMPLFYFLKPPRERYATIIKNISLYSYAMYLLHYTFILYLMQLWLDFNSLDIWQQMLCLLVYLMATYFGSYLVYTFFESPCTNLRESFRNMRFFSE